jgi:hypothetical protein
MVPGTQIEWLPVHSPNHLPSQFSVIIRNVATLRNTHKLLLEIQGEYPQVINAFRISNREKMPTSIVCLDSKRRSRRWMISSRRSSCTRMGCGIPWPNSLVLPKFSSAQNVSRSSTSEAPARACWKYAGCVVAALQMGPNKHRVLQATEMREKLSKTRALSFRHMRTGECALKARIN